MIKTVKIVIEVREKYYEACKDAIKEGYPSQLEETIGKGIPVDTSGDLISREALKNDISEKACDKFEKWNKLITLAEFETFIRDIIDDAPTIEPEITEKQAILFLINSGWLVNHDKELREKWERPKGEWARHDEWVNGEYVGGFYHIDCPVIEEGYAVYSRWATRFCPNCGADMRKGGAE